MSPNKKFAVVLIFLILGVSLAFLLVVAPLAKRVFSDAAVIVAKNEEAAKAIALRNHVVSFQKFSKDQILSFESIKSLFIDPEVPIPFIEFLEQSAVKENIELEIIPGIPKLQAGELWYAMDFQLSLSGLYKNINAFLQRIENAPYVLDIRGLTIARQGVKAQGTQNMDSILFLHVFTNKHIQGEVTKAQTP